MKILFVLTVVLENIVTVFRTHKPEGQAKEPDEIEKLGEIELLARGDEV